MANMMLVFRRHLLRIKAYLRGHEMLDDIGKVRFLALYAILVRYRGLPSRLSVVDSVLCGSFHIGSIDEPQIGSLLISSRDQYFRILSGESCRTSSDRCSQSTVPKLSIISFSCSIRRSLLPALQSSRYASILSIPRCIS